MLLQTLTHKFNDVYYCTNYSNKVSVSVTVPANIRIRLLDIEWLSSSSKADEVELKRKWCVGEN